MHQDVLELVVGEVVTTAHLDGRLHRPTFSVVTVVEASDVFVTVVDFHFWNCKCAVEVVLVVYEEPTYNVMWWNNHGVLPLLIIVN